MKKFKIEVFNKKQKKTVLSETKFFKTKKIAEAIYNNKYNDEAIPKFKIIITRLFRKPGVQTDLLTMIDEIQNGEN